MRSRSKEVKRSGFETHARDDDDAQRSVMMMGRSSAGKGGALSSVSGSVVRLFGCSVVRLFGFGSVSVRFRLFGRSVANAPTHAPA